MKRYEYIEHTGDIGIRAYGDSLEELFINAAQGLLEATADLSQLAQRHKLTLRCRRNHSKS